MTIFLVGLRMSHNSYMITSNNKKLHKINKAEEKPHSNTLYIMSWA